MNRSLIVIVAALAPLCLIPACKRANQPTPPQAASRPATAPATTPTAPLSAAESRLVPDTRAVEATGTQPARLELTKDEVILVLGDGGPAAPFRCGLLEPDSGKEVAAVQNGELTQAIP